MSTERNDIWKLAEAYLNGKLSGADINELDNRRLSDPEFASEFQDSINLLSAIKSSAEQKQVRTELKAANIELKQESGKGIKGKVVSLMHNHWRTATIAAAIALLTSLTTFWMVQHNNNKIASQYSLLKRDIEKYKRSQNKIIKDIKEQNAGPASSARYSGTGFALSNNGYLVTNYHVIEGADSIYIQSKDGAYHKAHTISFNAAEDVVILKVETDNFKFSNTTDIPYSIASDKKKLGTHVYTLGFPQDEIVYNEGYISSKNGYSGDSTQYRLEITAGPGQSGAPVLDSRGNIIGIITGKETEGEAVTFAVSSTSIIELLNNLPQENKFRLPTSGRLGRMSREHQIEQLEQFTCSIKVYKQ
ncbi:MAG: trypsin-like peptidase domain-containing protein [Chitinophagales bacterium]|nr:trypsin-like peptidase domain-containing protein [Chitinophagaceae bacterium]MCB9064072.1 trypsin-like peptidase domain-containing protein [Chitinophagales bacterium]